MKQKQKKKQNGNNKFNFDDEYIIGISTTALPSKQKISKKKVKKKNNKKDKKNTKKDTRKIPSRPKMHEKRSLAWNRIIKLFSVICLLVGAGAFLCLSPTFNLQEIAVEGNSIVSSDTIRSLSGIELYKNIFMINKADAVQHVQESSYVENAKISRVLPNKIRIKIEERIEKYLLEFAEGKYAILDGQGYILKITSEHKELPILIGAKTSIDEIIKDKGNKNRLCEKDLKKLDVVANIIQTAQNYEVDTFITKIDISDGDNFKLILEQEGKNVYLGNCTDLNTRILFMKEILNSQKGKNGDMFINGNLLDDKVFFRENV